jgi:putative DNA methylase
VRMIERWFPGAEVSEASTSGWGSGNAEKALFPWFAARPSAQAKAAVLTSLLPWPDAEREQRNLQALVRQSLTGLTTNQVADPEWKRSLSDKVRERQRGEADAKLRSILASLYPNGARMLDAFSGRGMIPLEAVKLGVRAYGIDYSPVATLAGRLLAEFPFRDWRHEPALPFEGYLNNQASPRLSQDIEFVLAEVGRRFHASMAKFYPIENGLRPWGYIWGVTLPCQECGRRFPLVGSLELRQQNSRKSDSGQSFYIEADRQRGTFAAVVHDGPPTREPIRTVAPGKHKYDSSGKVAVCPFCGHVHLKDVHTRLAQDGQGRDALLVVAEPGESVGKRFRVPTAAEVVACEEAERALAQEPPFAGGLAAVPTEQIPPGNTWTVQPSVYGAKTYGDLCNARQTLSFIRLARAISNVGREMLDAGVSMDYAGALCGYAAAALARKLRRSTRGAPLDVSRLGVHDIFGRSESSISFSYDYFEAGLGDGAGTWATAASGISRLVRTLIAQDGVSRIERGSALALPYRTGSLDAVVTDPPYDAMIDYSDASDLYYVWLKRALDVTHPDLSVTGDRYGVQEKSEEIIVKKGGGVASEHRTREFFDEKLAEAFSECRRVVKLDGIVTIVFGHGEPDVWRRLLSIVDKAGLVLTGSWPARTEKGGQEGSANITTTLTMSCAPAPEDRPVGRAVDVRAEIRSEVFERVKQWERDGLALTDQLMAAAGPAMEVAGRYSDVTDARGESVDLLEFVKAARQAVEEHTAIRVEDVPLSSFDPRTRFALFWARIHGRSVAPKSDARWQAMAAELTLDDLKGVLHTTSGGVRLATATEAKSKITSSSALIDVLLALSKAWPDGLDAVAAVMHESGRDDAEDHQLFAASAYLAAHLPEGDPDRQAWISLARNRKSLQSRATAGTNARLQKTEDQKSDAAQLRLPGMAE